ncbi:helix-turn-helix transcriptional regulator [uncultured Xylophilus sp.]|uniref:helix-turn-helix domain-containing protein n=1 Tax=uncultured Xylophilus sp. TaxID=296832 RepID=UPI0025E44913|nr:helix-turn-helix transcriptional regulator [uncultured Xylophilus sp.]
MSVFGARLKQARLLVGLSQEQVGIQADLDPMSASTRMNRYELGNRVPTYELVSRFAKVLKVPTAYFYSASEEEAELLLAFHKLSAAEKRDLLKSLRRS